MTRLLQQFSQKKKSNSCVFCIHNTDTAARYPFKGRMRLLIIQLLLAVRKNRLKKSTLKVDIQYHC